MGIIKAVDLAFEYIRRDEEGNVEGITRAVDGVNLDIQAGDFVAILGHNGSGKSTLAKHLNALLYPTEGTVFVDGKDVKQPENVWDIVEKIGLWHTDRDNCPEEVVLIKLAERLHNMRTIEYLAEEKRAVKAKETIEFYLPLARKVNNQKLLEELNDLGRKYL